MWRQQLRLRECHPDGQPNDEPDVEPNDELPNKQPHDGESNKQSNKLSNEQSNEPSYPQQPAFYLPLHRQRDVCGSGGGLRSRADCGLRRVEALAFAAAADAHGARVRAAVGGVQHLGFEQGYFPVATFPRGARIHHKTRVRGARVAATVPSRLSRARRVRNYKLISVRSWVYFIWGGTSRMYERRLIVVYSTVLLEREVKRPYLWWKQRSLCFDERVFKPADGLANLDRCQRVAVPTRWLADGPYGQFGHILRQISRYEQVLLRRNLRRRRYGRNGRRCRLRPADTGLRIFTKRIMAYLGTRYV